MIQGGGWPKHDPRTNFWLCEGCWNNQNWRHGCAGGFCECPKCTGMNAPAKVKFTAEGQTKIETDEVIHVRADS